MGIFDVSFVVRKLALDPIPNKSLNPNASRPQENTEAERSASLDAS